MLPFLLSYSVFVFSVKDITDLNKGFSLYQRMLMIMVGVTGFARLRTERWRGLTCPRHVIQLAPFESFHFQKQKAPYGAFCLWSE